MVEMEMAEQVAGYQTLDDEIASLAEDTTELGILAEDIFKNATAALFGQEDHVARSALEMTRQSAESYRAIHQKALDLLGRYMPSGESSRRIVELQQAAAEYTRVADISRRVAEHALELHGMSELELLRAGGDSSMLLLQLVRQAYIEVRGCIIAVSTRDTVLAKRLIAEDAELDHLFLSFKGALEQAISGEPYAAYPWHRLLLVGVHLEDIGNRVASACRAMLFTAPPTGI